MEIRIIPMSVNDKEFIGKSIKEVQNNFFMDYLKNIGKGWYYYGSKGIDAKEGDLLLFQMDNKIIASGLLDDVINFTKPTIDGNLGSYILNRKTIKVFKPILKDELKMIIKDFDSFNQVKQRFIKSSVDMDLLNKRMEVLNDEV